MYRALCAIALCAGLQAVAAAPPPQQAPAAPHKAHPGLMHATLKVPADPVPVGTGPETGNGPMKASLPGGVVVAVATPMAAVAPQAAGEQDHHPTTAAMLLAALALMTGIALRRWGFGRS